MRICCSKYTDKDALVIAKASEFGIPLIGGTALELWSSYLHHPGVRTRSDNDLDFISNNPGQIALFQDWVQSNIDPDKVQVDIMRIKSHDIEPYITEIDGVVTMSLPYILWSKLTRRSPKDLQDIRWILSVPQLSDEEIVSTLEDLGVTEKEIVLLESL